MTGLISDDGAVSGTCRQNGRSQDTRQEGWLGGRLLVRGVKAKTPIFTNRIRSQKNSLLSRTGGFFWSGGRGGSGRPRLPLHPLHKSLPEGGDVSTRFCKGCKGKTPHFYQSDQISKKLSFVSNLRVFLGGRRKASEGLVCLYTLYKLPAEPTHLSTIRTCPGHET